MSDHPSDIEIRVALIYAKRHMEREDAAGLNQLPQKLTEIDIKLGGIFDHLSMLNHRTEKSEGRLNVLEVSQAAIVERVRGEAKVSGLTWGIVSSVAVGAITFLLGKR